ncbi:MAG: lipopolysaccharide heptosyltransferase I [Betaproteobacteria bacterium]|nr:lipopolysaccharide heptosyltransferase I [Betaproteobacteria bacterium]MDE2056714.1 lipopolysaccharide heptosyltransferase I [Betaproteobacteria bacterium]
MSTLLLIKTSSLGDVIHALPAVTDLAHYRPEIEIDWLVEESFKEIPALHNQVKQVKTIALRRWRHHWLQVATWRELFHRLQDIRHTSYDLSIDCQGLIKSAVIARLLPGRRHGFDKNSIREPLASYCYQHTHHVSWQLHAVERNRQLFAQVFGYTPPQEVDYGIAAPPLLHSERPLSPYVVFLHATSRASKEWPIEHWVDLGQQLAMQGLAILLPSGNAKEHHRAQLIAKEINGAFALPKSSLTKLASLLQEAEFVVGVDTGLTHLAVALKQKVIAIYTDTDPQATGVYGSERAVNVGGIGMMPEVSSIMTLCL